MDEIEKTFKYLLYSRAFRSIGLVYSGLAFSLYLSALHITPIFIGIIAAFVVLVNVMLSLIYGIIGDRKNFKTELILSEFVTFLGSLLVAVSANLFLISMGLMLAGFSGGAGGMRGSFSPGSNAYIANNYRDEKERVRKYSLLSLVASISSIGGGMLFTFASLLSHYIGEVYAYRIMFAFSSLLIFLSFLFLLKLKERRKQKKRSLIMNKRSFNYVSKVIIVNSLGGAGIGLLVPILPLWLKLRYGINSVYIGILFDIVYITTALGLYLSLRYAIRFESLKIAYLTRMIQGVLLILMALSPIFFLAAIFYILRSMVSGFGAPSRTNVNIRGISNEDYGTASSIQGIATRVSQLSSGAAGYLMDLYLPLPLEIAGILQVLSGVAYKLLI